ncbi:hypothetical protein [Streptomyces sp. NPDC050704]|uniref:hypothetical protein n=1 Tax=Streptomyces sp. NPDC050704 TaxID=3157219 RepID=UPI003434358E
MPARPLKAVLATAIVASLSLAAAPARAGDGPHGHDPKVVAELAKTYVATAKYHWEPNALKDGYVPTECVADPKLGGMGYHYVKESLFGSVDPRKPAALLYEDGHHGERNLVAVEWIVADADQKLGTDGDRPSMFGVPFDGPMPGHAPGMPVHYELHAWLHKKNPKGLFAPWNPRVKCPKATPAPKR